MYHIKLPPKTGIMNNLQKKKILNSNRNQLENVPEERII